MIVYKFGGASLKDYHSVMEVKEIIKTNRGDEMIIVVSAMGKTTNLLEEIFLNHTQQQNSTEELIGKLYGYHLEISHHLFSNRSHPIFNIINDLIQELKMFLMISQGQPADHIYDGIVVFGELFSSKILSAYLEQEGILNQWLDARSIIKTDSRHKNANIDWDLTSSEINHQYKNRKYNILLTQGFIGSSADNITTTLGREGSDYTAAIISFCLDAEKVVIWKDVPGVYNADPKSYKEAVLIPELSYYDAIEMTYYGATVIHPKTIKPLQNKKIPLFVKSFLEPESSGTVIRESYLPQMIPTYVHKTEQILISIIPHDFSFVAEENLKDIFECLTLLKIRVNLMQLTALNFVICVDLSMDLIKELSDNLGKRYSIKYNANCSLLTIRHFNEKLIKELSSEKEILLEQRSRQNIQLVLRDKI